MSPLWLGAAALLAVALAFLLVPLWRQRRSSGRWSWSAMAAVLLVVPFTLALYGHVRTWQPEIAARAASEQALVARLAERMTATPDDVEGWRLLGRSYVSLGEYRSARLAFDQAWRRTAAPDNELKLSYAEAQILDNQETLAEDAGRLVEDVLAEEPANPKALWYGAQRALAVGDRAATRERLIRLLDTGVVPAELAQVIRAQLAQIDIDAGPVASRPAEAGEAGGAGDAGEGARVEIDVALAESLETESLGPNAMLFIFARAPGGGPPVAALRVPAAALPGRFVLSDANAMLPGASLTDHDELVLVARLSGSGEALEQPGDLFGEQRIRPASAEPVELLIDRRVE